MLDRFEQQLPGDRFLLLRYDELLSDNFGVVSGALQQFGYPLSEPGRQALEALCERSKGYQSGHQYCLSEFGLDQGELESLFGISDSSARELQKAEL